MPQLTSSNSSVPVSYPLYLDLSSIKSAKPYSLPFPEDHCFKQNMLNFNLFYENILGSHSSFYSLHPQFLADSVNYYLGQGYQNGDRTVTSKSFSIESILSSPSKSDIGTDPANSPKQVSPSSTIGTLQCKLPSSSMFHSPTTSVGNKDYFMKESKCSTNNYGEQLNLGTTNLERTYPGVSKKSSRISKQAGKMSLSSTNGGKSKRVRTIFTPEQLERLETEFERQQYMVGTGRLYLASTLNLTEAQVKVWFQNRRIKWRKQHLDGQQDKSSQESKDSHL